MPNKVSGGVTPGNMGKIVFAVVALIAAAGFIFWYMRSNAEHEVGHAEQPPGTNIKLQEMKAMKDKAAESGAAPAPGSDPAQAGKPAPHGGQDPMSQGDK